MPVYHFTVHAYRSWNPDNRRGYVHHTDGLKPPDKSIATARSRNASSQPVVFDTNIQRILLLATIEECTRHDWRFHGFGSDLTHIHAILSWKGFLEWSAVLNRWKNVMSFVLGRDIGPRGRRWFVRGGSRKRVMDRAHLDYLLTEYLPSHRGVLWREGMSLP